MSNRLEAAIRIVELMNPRRDSLKGNEWMIYSKALEIVSESLCDESEPPTLEMGVQQVPGI